MSLRVLIDCIGFLILLVLCGKVTKSFVSLQAETTKNNKYEEISAYIYVFLSDSSGSTGPHGVAIRPTRHLF